MRAQDSAFSLSLCGTLIHPGLAAQTQFGLSVLRKSKSDQVSLRTVTDEELAQEYAEAARRRGEALGVGDSDRANREFDGLTAIYREFKRRGTGALDWLMAFGQNRDPNVRAAVGWALIELFPKKAKAILKEVATLPGLPGFSANMTLRLWEKGQLKFPDAAD